MSRAEYQHLYLLMQQARSKSELEYMRAKHLVMAHPLSGIKKMPLYMETFASKGGHDAE